MIDPLVWEFDQRSGRLYIHFDVSEHYLSLDTFIGTAESARKMIKALDETFFNGDLNYELIVLPPKEGTFLSKLGLVVAGPMAVFAFLNTDVGGAYVEGLTGLSPSEWAKTFGEDHRALIDDALEEINYLDEENQSDFIPEVPQKSSENACKEAAQVVVAMTRGILEKKPDELKKIGMDIGALHDAVDARADFYTACIEDHAVKAVGFAPEDDFPIPRNSFPARAQRPLRKEETEEPAEWSVATEAIYVTSPNWDKEDQSTRQWKGKDQIRRACYFVIDDAEFWQKVKNKALHVDVLDSLKVQWAFQNIDGRPRNRRVLRVLEFNGEKLADPLPPEAVGAIIGEYSEYVPNKGERTLFDE